MDTSPVQDALSEMAALLHDLLYGDAHAPPILLPHEQLWVDTLAPVTLSQYARGIGRGI